VALVKQQIPTLIGKLDTGTADEIAVPGTLLRLQNGVMRTTGRIQKRDGCARVGPAVGSADWLAAYGNELVAGSATSLYTYRPASNAWTNRGAAPRWLPTLKQYGGNTRDQHTPQLAYARGMLFVCYQADTTATTRAIYYYAIDIETGGTVVSDTLVASVVNGVTADPGVRMLVVGDHVMFLYRSATNTITARTLNLGSPGTLSSTANVATNARAVVTHNSMQLQSWDVTAPASGGDVALIAYGSTAALQTVSIRWNVRTNALVNSLTWTEPTIPFVGSNVTPLCFAVHDLADGYAYLVYYSVNAGVFHLSEVNRLEFANVTPPAVTAAGINVGANGRFAVAYYDTSDSRVKGFIERGSSTTDTNMLIEGAIFSATGLGSTGTLRRSAGIAGQPFLRDGVWYLPCSYYSTTQPTDFVISSAGKIAAKVLAGNGGGHSNTSRASASVAVDGETLLAMPRRVAVAYQGSTVLASRQVSIVTLTGDEAGPPVEAGDTLLIPGALTRCYDGREIAEHAFHLYPPPAVTQVAVGGTTTAGTHYVVLTYRWTDARGRIHRSAPSDAFQINSGGANAYTVTAQTLRWTDHTDVIIEAWATIAGAGPDADYYAQGTVTNDPTVDTLSITALSETDANLSAREALYVGADGAVLENIGPPAFSAMATWKGRAWGVMSEDRTRVWFTKEIRPDYGPAWNDETNVVVIADEEGDINAIGGHGDQFYFLKRNAIYYTLGEGPNDTGDGEYAQPAKLPVTIGTDSPHIAVTGDGLIFRASGDPTSTNESVGGFHLLAGGAVQYIGAQVESYNGLTLSGAVVLPDLMEARFSTEEGTTLIYDWYHKQWYTAHGQRAEGACRYQNRFAFVDADGVVCQESADEAGDDGVPVPTLLEFAPISFAGLEGQERVYAFRLVGKYRGAHRLRVTLDADGTTGGEARRQWVVNMGAEYNVDLYGAATPYGQGVYGGVNQMDGTFRWEFKLPIGFQTGTNFRLTVEDVYPDAVASRGFDLTAVVWTVGIKPGRRRLPASRIVTAT
jgi:hypothetical protein